MATISKKNMFNEATRVQMPAMVHLTRLGYTYFGKITEDMAGTVYDPDTNILINVFKEQFARLNPTHVGEVEQTLKTIRQGFIKESRKKILPEKQKISNRLFRNMICLL